MDIHAQAAATNAAIRAAQNQAAAAAAAGLVPATVSGVTPKELSEHRDHQQALAHERRLAEEARITELRGAKRPVRVEALATYHDPVERLLLAARHLARDLCQPPSPISSFATVHRSGARHASTPPDSDPPPVPPGSEFNRDWDPIVWSEAFPHWWPSPEAVSLVGEVPWDTAAVLKWFVARTGQRGIKPGKVPTRGRFSRSLKLRPGWAFPSSDPPRPFDRGRGFQPGPQYVWVLESGFVVAEGRAIGLGGLQEVAHHLGVRDDRLD